MNRGGNDMANGKSQREGGSLVAKKSAILNGYRFFSQSLNVRWQWFNYLYSQYWENI